MSTGNRVGILIGIMVLILVGWCSLTFQPSGRSAHRPAPVKASEPYSCEHLLAVIQEDDLRLPVSHPTVGKFARLLDRLERKTGASRECLSDVSTYTHRSLKKRVAGITLLRVVEKLDSVIPNADDYLRKIDPEDPAYLTKVVAAAGKYAALIRGNP